MGHKSLRDIAVKNADKGEVAAVFSTFNVVDKDGDVTLPGAFKNGQEVVISAYGHTSWGGALPVGKGVILATDTEAIMESKFFMDTTQGRDTFTVVKELAEAGLGEWSYGFETIESSFGKFADQDVQFLKSLDVFEVSPVLRGAGENTRTLSAKGLKFNEEGDQVLALVNAYLERASEVMVLRSAKGRSLSAESLEQLNLLDDGLVKLRGLLDIKADIPEDITADWLRFLQFQNQGVRP